MSTNSEESVLLNFPEEVPVPSPENENDSPQEPFHLITAESELVDDKQCDIKTIESQDNDITEDEQANTKRSRELKMLLALSKEANLDVNISHKRKSLDTFKLKEATLTPNKLSYENEPILKKSKIDKFPITAESEIESMASHGSNLIDVSNVDKTKKEDGVISEERKHMRDVKVFKPNKDIFCWRCHREAVNVSCETCPRSYHQKCLKQTISDVDNWPCPECVAILKAESTQTRSPAMKGMTLEHLCSLLKFAVKRMIECNGVSFQSEPFHHPVNDKLFPEYKKYIIQPMNLTLLEKNIKENLYGSTQAFEADAKWILHNSIIFNSYQSKLTTNAKSILKICKQEMAEIENCPSCYLNANTKKSTWFVEVCPKPHILVWAKLKGFPYWPAKAMCTNNSSMVDVRFFGAHDRAWVPSKECFLYSRRDPNSNKQKRNDIIECMREVEVYIANIKALYGEFNYAPFKMQYDPENELKQLLLFIPRYRPNAPPPKKRFKSVEPKTTVKKEECEEKEEKEEVEGIKEVLEGYGTDDETLENEKLDSFKSNLPVEQGCDAGPSVEKEESDSSDSQEEDEGDDNIEPEIDDDTQLSSNILEDKVPRGTVRTRGGLNLSPGKLKTIPRRISEESTTKKRLSPDELSPPSKIARRNSDQSIKSDSSRLSSLSDKINRVDISENVELTLGNTADSYITSSTVELETRKRPVQVEVDNSELSISPQSKTKIADRLMQKLSPSDEDISQCSEDNKGSEDKLETDVILEKYRNLVKKKSMEFSNVEASTSFGITSVVSKGVEVCVSSNDLNERTEEIMDVVESDQGKSEVPNENEQTEESRKSDDNEMDISSTEHIRTDTNEIEIENILEPQKDLEETMPAFLEEQLEDDIPLKFIVQEEKVTEKDEPAESVSVQEDEEKEAENDKADISPEVDSRNENESLKVPQNNLEKDVDLQKQNTEKDKIEVDEGKISEITIEPISDKTTVEKLVPNSEKAKLTPGMQVKNKTTLNVEQVKPTALKSKVVEKVETEQKLGVSDEPTTITKIEGKTIITYSRKDRKSSEIKRKESPVIEQPTDSNSSDDQGLVLDDTQIDETNIRNIIHSSLNNISKDTSNASIDNEGKTAKRKCSNTNIEEISVKKIKVSKVEKDRTKKGSTFKIVPIQHILNKSIDEKPPEHTVVTSNPILLKKLSQPSGNPTVVDTPGPQPLDCVEIKSEPESDEDSQESQYMEAKRKYMSALNISEKTEEVITPKKNEIRTRSKREEMVKGRQMDNLSKVIEEVATTFSAKHASQKKIMERKNNIQPAVTVHAAEERRKVASQENGEIFVKSFAKMAQQPHSQQVRAPQRPQPTQKPKQPATSTNKGSIIVRREFTPRHNMEPIPQTTLTKITPVPVSSSNSSNTVSTPSTSNNKTLESLSSSGNVLILTQPGVILPTSQQLTYNAGSFVTFVPSQQNMAMMQTPQVINAVMAPSIHQSETVQQTSSELNRSQNYIPQNEEIPDNTNRAVNPSPNLNSSSATMNHIQNREIPSLIPITDNESNNIPTPNNNTTRSENADDEFSLIHSMVPESVSKAISEVLCRPPPKLKPRPPGPLSQVFDSGTPSSAGPVSAKINSISHRLGDYFRGMLVEMLEDLGKVNNPEATIASLKHEIETLQQKHAAEMMDIRKNVCTILKDIQGSIVEERERLIDETRSACEIEALRRIEEAKSKQWCANCGKEAQFYCCWNTSYCDYSCQIKQWSKHMSKCTQHAGQSQPGQSPAIRPQSQLSFRPATSKGFSGRLVAKPTKVYLNRTTNSKAIPTFKATPGGHLTLVDSSNLEILANTPGTKFIATSSLFTRVRNVNSTVTSPSNGTLQADSPSQKVKVCGPVVRPSPSTSNNASNLISDEDMESD
ncbi:protein kinase C-binding protein 1-like isoform X2 [Coccinella septempunctata]|uniref:protein kinase C-binding protein 1-like isoform X2 n=1 Tax=Coccinella septempunctata TaxID=41139 RepID=UPI001D0971F4|nr:protein kinase C-binding protein 1-like isoform X2 [Coccinella septempunctata]